MKLCATCGEQWDTVDSRCPNDGGVLTVVGGTREHTMRRGSASSSSQVAVAVIEAPAPDPGGPSDDLAVGTKVGEYVIERKIGVGGMGEVYGARHPVIGKRAAIKVLNSRLSVDREAVARFVVEAQSVNQIGHANIVDIFAFGTLPDGRSYFAMEWLQGETLGERLDRGRLGVRDAIAILSTLSRALEAAHAAGVIHRDLKPDNVFLATDDDGYRVKLLDFGIAKLQTGGPSMSRTATGIVVGTPLFMAPEQAKGEPIDGRTDVYALGLLAYTIVCGVSLFQDEASAIEVLAAHITKVPPAPRTIVPDLPVELDTLILEMVHKHPSFRPTLPEIRQRLAEIGVTLGAPRPSTAPVIGRRTVATPEAHFATAPAMPALSLGTMPAVTDPEAIAPVARGMTKWPIVIGAFAAIAIGVTVYVAMGRGAEPGQTQTQTLSPPTPAPTPETNAMVVRDAAVEVAPVAPAVPAVIDAAVVPTPAHAHPHHGATVPAAKPPTPVPPVAPPKFSPPTPGDPDGVHNPFKGN